jgi:hypothetical protein
LEFSKTSSTTGSHTEEKEISYKKGKRHPTDGKPAKEEEEDQLTEAPSGD